MCESAMLRFLCNLADESMRVKNPWVLERRHQDKMAKSEKFCTWLAKYNKVNEQSSVHDQQKEIYEESAGSRWHDHRIRSNWKRTHSDSGQSSIKLCSHES